MGEGLERVKTWIYLTNHKYLETVHMLDTRRNGYSIFWASQYHLEWLNDICGTFCPLPSHPMQFEAVQLQEGLSRASDIAWRRKVAGFDLHPVQDVSNIKRNMNEICTSTISHTFNTLVQLSSNNLKASHHIRLSTCPCFRIVIIGPKQWSMDARKRVIGCRNNSVREQLVIRRNLPHAACTMLQASHMLCPIKRCYGGES